MITEEQYQRIMFCFKVFCIALMVGGLYSAYNFDPVFEDKWTSVRSEVFTITFTANKVDFLGGIFYPVLLALKGRLLGWMVIALMFFYYLANLALGYRYGMSMILVAMLIANYAAYGLEIRPLFMLGTLLAPLLLVIMAGTTIVVSGLEEIKRTWNKIK